MAVFIVTIKGSRRVISTSKIRKITAIRKNCRENGIRAEVFGSNPHSNGDLFSRSINVFFEITVARVITRSLIIRIIVVIDAIMNITYTSFIRSLDWKSRIIIILYRYLPHQ